ncbi:Mitogen-activated protein kinase [Actinidia chinensis var. chinensis]|uniref:mitogen-activated protein kinase kinase n=1 Tax=Actinidia chinensis var. chinensis TaxID=1590841 RepID=A0A2R6PMK2_ACTCC|nr:Mitogen-activated protein kinase [Actinidia chinensis var. chinensis]
MSLVRERRNQQALRLSVPPPVPAVEYRRRSPQPSPASSLASNESPRIDSLINLEKLAVLGHGNGGTVYKVRHRHTGSIYALKVLRFDEDAVAVRQQAAREAEILMRVDSQLIVKCHGVFHNGVGDSDCAGCDLYFVMEYMEAGSLHDVLQMHHRLPEQAISGIARRVLEGLHYLQGMQIVHRDIKPSNLLINNRGEIKIADFGVSGVMAGKLEVTHDPYMGTSAYMSPERFDPERWDGDFSDGFAGDIWSLGLVVWECHVGHYPLIGPGQKPDWATLMCAICFGGKMEMPDTASPEFRSFVWRCLEKDWKKRGTVTELLTHPFVTKWCSMDSIAAEELVDYALEG